MLKRVLVTSAAALLSVAAAATVANGTTPGIDWPASPSIRIVSAGQGGGDTIDWPTPPSAPTNTRGGESGVGGGL
ncbi:hypothetical protein ACFXA3_40325 [Streptomyces sp. NPDC059456]|uniref:hypothetical protein n=1 Tax=Streptomyces sp. NPDC059456 TaxID=3346838 RepID=UPI0036CFFCDC